LRTLSALINSGKSLNRRLIDYPVSRIQIRYNGKGWDEPTLKTLPIRTDVIGAARTGLRQRSGRLLAL